MQLIPPSQRISFGFRGKRYATFGTLNEDEDLSGRILSRNEQATPANYSQAEFHTAFAGPDKPAHVLLYNGHPVVLLPDAVYNFRPPMPVPPCGLSTMREIATEYAQSNAGSEYFIRLLPSDAHPMDEWCRYEYTTPMGGIFQVVARTVGDCRIYRDQWLQRGKEGRDEQRP